MVRIATLDDGGQLTPDQVPALATLGATATGEALIEAVDAAAARTALGMTAAGSAVATAADASVQRTALELGGAATLAVGTTTGTVAAGDDSRITGALPAANLDTAATALDANAASALRVQQDARLSSTFAPIAATVTGANIIFDGDSITAGNSGGVLDVYGNSFPHFAALLSKGRVRYLGSLAVPGSRLDEMVTRFDSTVATYAPSVVHLIGGTNNVSQGHSVTVFLGHLEDYLAKCRGIGARLILGTLPPREATLSATRRALTLAYNAAIKRFAAEHGLDVIDYYAALVNPATGGFASGLGNADEVHPTNAGNRVMGQLAAGVFATILPAVDAVALPQENADTNNKAPNGLALGSITSEGVPSACSPVGWDVLGGTWNTGLTATMDATDTTVPGEWLVIDVTPSFTGNEYLTTTDAACVAGNRYAAMGRIKATGLRGSNTGNGTTIYGAIVFNSNNAAGYRTRFLNNTAHDIDDGVFYVEMVAPVDATTVEIHFQFAANTVATAGEIRLTQFGIYDLTALGLA